MSLRGSGNFKNVRKNAREQRLQFMNSQAALIDQKKKEIEEKLAQQQQQQQKEVKVEPKIEPQEVISGPEEVAQSPPKAQVLPFKNDGSFLEKFRQMQQQNAKPIVSSSSMDSASQHLQTDYTCPPPSVDVSIPPPSLPTSSTSYFVQHPPPSSFLSTPPPIKIKEEIKEERRSRSPSPYSPSRPCEDEDDLAYFNKDYHQPGPSNSSEDSGNFSQSSGQDMKRKFKEEADDSENSKLKERERKRQSRWGPQELKTEPAIVANSLPQIPNIGFAGPSTGNQTVLARSSVLSRITSADPQILTYAVRVFGTTDLTEDQWKQCMDQVKMQYVYQEMLRKKEERDKLAMAGRVRYEYDSDEETDEHGTWEHKRRLAEMEKTREWADQLTERNRGKHHLGHFLPPEELAKFMEKFQAVQEGRTIDESDYKEFKIAENNVGYQMLKKFGWTEGEGLGIGGSGITAPVNATRRNEAQGLGASKPEELSSNDDEYDAYRKRMMLAYRFRPNPLNNPRRAYY